LNKRKKSVEGVKKYLMGVNRNRGKRRFAFNTQTTILATLDFVYGKKERRTRAIRKRDGVENTYRPHRERGALDKTAKRKGRNPDAK